jgi:TRAP-type C4-dicarboxylate transport system permease small subunit
MRFAFAHVMALVIYICVLFFCFALVIGLGGNLRLGYRFDSQAFGFAIIYMMFIGPFALILMLVYFALLRASMRAIIILLVPSIIGFAFLSRILLIRADVYLWIGIVWAGVTAALVHHLVYAALRPRVLQESISHG